MKEPMYNLSDNIWNISNFLRILINMNNVNLQEEYSRTVWECSFWRWWIKFLVPSNYRFFNNCSAQDVQAFFSGGLKFSSGGLFLFKKKFSRRVITSIFDEGKHPFTFLPLPPLRRTGVFNIIAWNLMLILEKKQYSCLSLQNIN